MSDPGKRYRTGTVMLVLITFLTGGILTGCSPDNENKPPTRTKQANDNRRKTIDKLVNEIVRPLKLLRESYPAAVKDETIADQAQYEKARRLADDALTAWKKSRRALKQELPDEQYTRLNQTLTELIKLIDSNGPATRRNKLVNGAINTLTALRTQGIPKARRGTVRSIKQADRDIQAETTVQNYRIGATLLPATAIHKQGSTISPIDGNTHQLRVLLREKRTKRFLPGASIEAKLEGPNGEETLSLDLLETWGPYHFYGRNLTVPSNATRLNLAVKPPKIGRHADMKELYIKPASVSFPLSKDTGEVTLEGSKPQPVADDVTLGGDVSMALEETISTTVRSPYRIGFIAENAEPFWVFDTYESSDLNNAYNVRLADIPQSANRHLEIVLFDEQSNRMIPHADVKLKLTSTVDNSTARITLPFLLSSFYHYGNSLYLPPMEYSVKATVAPPAIHTLKKNIYSDTRTATFTWEPDNGEAEELQHSGR